MIHHIVQNVRTTVRIEGRLDGTGLVVVKIAVLDGWTAVHIADHIVGKVVELAGVNHYFTVNQVDTLTITDMKVG